MQIDYIEKGLLSVWEAFAAGLIAPIAGHAIINTSGLPVQDHQLSWVIVEIPQLDTSRKQQLTLIAKFKNQIVISKHFKWPNGKNIFDTHIGHLHRILGKNKDLVYAGIVKWNQHLNATFNFKSTMQVIWQPFLSAKESCFSWQVIYHIPTTNVWRFQHLLEVQPKKQCKCMLCKVDQVIIIHCLWRCRP